MLVSTEGIVLHKSSSSSPTVPGWSRATANYTDRKQSACSVVHHQKEHQFPTKTALSILMPFCLFTVIENSTYVWKKKRLHLLEEVFNTDDLDYEDYDTARFSSWLPKLRRNLVLLSSFDVCIRFLLVYFYESTWCYSPEVPIREKYVKQQSTHVRKSFNNERTGQTFTVSFYWLSDVRTVVHFETSCDKE